MITQELSQARQFLTLLAENEEQFTFQAIFPDKKRGMPSPRFHGTFEEHTDILVRLNNQGYGIFVSINTTNLKGSSIEDITGIRGAWQDNDGEGKPLPVREHIRVLTSPGRTQSYILGNDLTLEDGINIQRTMVAKWGSDPQIGGDISRLGRLPGFLHTKNPNNPHLVVIEQTSGEQPLEREELLRVLQVEEQEERRSNPAPSHVGQPMPEAQVKRIQSALSYIPADPYQNWLQCGMALHSDGSLQARELWDQWSEQSKKFNPVDQDRTWASFSQGGGITLGRLFYLAKMHDWKQLTYTRTDLGNAERLADRYGDRIRYCHGRKQWYLWNGVYWESDKASSIMRLAKETVKRIYCETKHARDEDERKEIAKHAMRSESRDRLKAMVELGQHEEGIYITMEQFDSDLDLIGCRNGTLNTKTGQFIAARQSDYITKALGVNYDPSVRCPAWEQFLLDVMDGDKDLVRFLQLAVGYSLTGDVTEQCLFFLYGSGRNGKSTFIDTLIALFGDYALKAPTEMLMHVRHDRSQQETARLPGRRFVVVNETGDGSRFNEALIKDLTGGDRLTGRFLYNETFEFDPTHTLWIYGNHQPDIRGTDEGIWRRFRTIPFDRKFDDGDPELGRKLLAELPGILNWAIEGCIAWRKERLPMPQAVREATAAYRSTMDIVGAFIEQCCIVGPQYSSTAALLYKTYKEWCAISGERVQNQRRFGTALSERGYVRAKIDDPPKHGWRGIGVIAEFNSCPDPSDPSDRQLQDFSMQNPRDRNYTDRPSEGSGRVRKSPKKLVRCVKCRNLIPTAKNPLGECGINRGGKTAQMNKMELRECDDFKPNRNLKQVK